MPNPSRVSIFNIIAKGKTKINKIPLTFVTNFKIKSWPYKGGGKGPHTFT